MKEVTDEDLSLVLLEMGCLPGEPIHIECFAPMGDPVAIKVDGSVLSMRLDMAEKIIVAPAE